MLNKSHCSDFLGDLSWTTLHSQDLQLLRGRDHVQASASVVIWHARVSVSWEVVLEFSNVNWVRVSRFSKHSKGRSNRQYYGPRFQIELQKHTFYIPRHDVRYYSFIGVFGIGGFIYPDGWHFCPKGLHVWVLKAPSIYHAGTWQFL